MTTRAVMVTLAASSCAIFGCQGQETDSDVHSVDVESVQVPSVDVPSGEWYRPSVGTTWQWQLSGDIDTTYDVDLYDIDLFDAPQSTIDQLHADGRTVICYFSAGSSEEWRDDDASIPDVAKGEPLDGWAGERWLDVRSSGVLDTMTARLDLAVSKECDGVEPDNVAGYDDDTGFDFDRDDQIAYNVALSTAAHARGLAVGLKNASELIPVLLDRYDFSVNEQCHEFDECEPYSAFIDAGKPVFNVEYADRFVAAGEDRRQLCEAATALRLQTLVLPLELDGEFRFSCATDGSG